LGVIARGQGLRISTTPHYGKWIKRPDFIFYFIPIYSRFCKAGYLSVSHAKSVFAFSAMAGNVAFITGGGKFIAIAANNNDV
jgi:hypothetical protein